MRRPELLLVLFLLGFAGFVGLQIARAPRLGAAAPSPGDEGSAQGTPRYGAHDDAGRVTPVAAADPAVAAATRRAIAERSFGTYIDEIVAQQDSSLARWPDRAPGPIRVWVQPNSGVEGWSAYHPQLARDAFLAWEQIGLPIRFAFVDDSATADAAVVWVDHLVPPTRIGSTHRFNDQQGWVVSGVIEVATHGSDRRVLNENAVRSTALHEVGHLIGLNHTADTTSIMASELHDAHRLSSSDKATAALLYSLPPGSLK